MQSLSAGPQHSMTGKNRETSLSMSRASADERQVEDLRRCHKETIGGVRDAPAARMRFQRHLKCEGASFKGTRCSASPIHDSTSPLMTTPS